MFFSFGLWNVLLLPMSIKVLGATEFEYGLQEGLTSVGFVIGSFFMARFGRRLPEPIWIIVAMTGMGISGILYGLATSVPIAILLVDGLRVLQLAIVRVEVHAAAAGHPTGDARPCVLGLLRHARRHLPGRHGGRRSRRHHRHPGHDHPRVQPADRVRPVHPRGARSGHQHVARCRGPAPGRRRSARTSHLPDATGNPGRLRSARGADQPARPAHARAAFGVRPQRDDPRGARAGRR